MFVRAKKRKNGTQAIQIVNNIRQGNKIRQKVIKHVGTAHNEEELKILLAAAHQIKEEFLFAQHPVLFTAEQLKQSEIKSSSKSTLPVDLKYIREKQRIITGFHHIFGDLYRQIGFDKVFSCYRVSGKVIEQLVLGRIAAPLSKLATVEYISRHFGFTFKPEQVYRAMDKINEEKIEKIKNITFNYTRSLFEQEITIVFYDCTTLYFESFTDDELRNFGFSKDYKHNQVQVILALAVTREGLPLGYDLFAGNIFEGHTMKKMVETLKEKFDKSRFVMVMDAAMLSKENIEYLQKENIGFIVGARLKNLPEEIKEKILDKSAYTMHTQKEKKKGKEKSYQVGYLRTSYGGDLDLIVSYHEKRAEKDAADRQKNIERLQERWKKTRNIQSFIGNRGYKRYLKVEGESRLEIDTEKIEKDAQWDGLHGVITNLKDVEVEAILSQYRGLWQVEESFRIHKHELSVRPVFHWTPRRIKAHIAIVYMAFSLMRYLQHKLQQAGHPISIAKAKESLMNVQASVLSDTRNGKHYALPSHMDKNAKEIYRIFNKKYNLTPYELII